MRLAAVFWVFSALAQAASAECAGANLIDALSPEARAELDALTAAQPYATGNFWTATRGDERMTLLGTYHLDDPRHAATLDWAAPLVEGAGALLVEAGPDEEAQIMDRIGRDPSLMMITTGPTLYQRLPPATWDAFRAAMETRGIPAFMAAKFQPWYAVLLLAIPACALTEMIDPKGLDGALIDAAVAAGVPVQALEPYDTLFAIFGTLGDEMVIAMLDQTLAMEDQAEDLSVTLADAYFAGDSRAMWEFMRVTDYPDPAYTRERVDADLAAMEEVMMAARNRAWIPVIEAAADATEGPLVVAFGALHLAGDEGVLNLLAGQGWALEPLLP
jgi:uncharacterized protein